MGLGRGVLVRGSAGDALGVLQQIHVIAIRSVQRIARGVSSVTAARSTNRLALIVISGLLVVAASCSIDAASDDRPIDESSATTRAATEAADASLSGVAVNITNAVAPFDHGSNVDWQLLASAISRPGIDEWQYLSDCMAAEGFELPPLAPPLERDDPILISNWQFPPVDILTVEGFTAVPPIPSSPEDFEETSTRTDAHFESLQSCGAAAEEEFKGSDRARAYELYAMVRGSWEELLTEIDGSDEIRPLAEGFSVCLRDEGIPVDYTVSERRLLGYVDELLWGADSVAEEEARIRERYGKLYAECGRELFEAKERLRSGERRVAFLAEHEEAIRGLSDLLSGLGLED